MIAVRSILLFLFDVFIKFKLKGFSIVINRPGWDGKGEG